MTVGLALIIVSLYPTILIAQETIAENRTLSRYELQQVINIRNEFAPGERMEPPHQLDAPLTVLGSVIEVIPENTNIATPITRFYKKPGFFTKVIIKINGKEAAPPTLAQLTQDNDTDTRFLSWLNIVKVTDHKTDTQKVAIVQRVSDAKVAGQDHDQYMRDLTWRILYVGEDKQVTIEQFSYPERGKHMLGTYLAIFSSQTSTFIGLTNDSLSYLPSYLYPFLYPVVTVFFGIIFSIIGTIILIIRGRKRRKEKIEI